MRRGARVGRGLLLNGRKRGVKVNNVWSSFNTMNIRPIAISMNYSSFNHSDPTKMYGTTILCVKNKNKLVVIGDGQVSQGSSVVKPNAKKVRRLSSPDKPPIVCGFAGSAADAFTLMERLIDKLEKHQGQLLQAVVGLAKDWRMDKYLRNLEATLIVADSEAVFNVSGNGDVLEPHDGVVGIGSGGIFAASAARALMDAVPEMDAEEMARRAMKIAADTCIYTNHNWIVEVVEKKESDIFKSKTDSPGTSGNKQHSELSQTGPIQEPTSEIPPATKEPEAKEQPKTPPTTKKSWQID
eukprot:TRINITY_DN2520_c0_g1_i1.p1 TRINITY_DN2520_c0_g1~~TRINITY_DN2520_c0_g1_i1.p1  ORF type:complete len:297 (-),score=67.91 TRINITY_DN2520_c0_g1_i1:3-893(-)